MQVNAKVDYALRAKRSEARGVGSERGSRWSPAQSQSIPLKFLENILLELRHAGLVISQRGAVGGYRLGREPGEITLADVIRVVDGPLANVRGLSPERLEYHGPATVLTEVWIALRANMRAVLEEVTLDDLRHGRLPDDIHALAEPPDARSRR